MRPQWPSDDASAVLLARAPCPRRRAHESILRRREVGKPRILCESLRQAGECLISSEFVLGPKSSKRIQADLDATDPLRHMNQNNSERSVCSTHPLVPISTSFLFVFDTELVMSTYEHQGRDIVL